jgi:UDP-3-O-acyl-N-acetylglucosamine deacetylase
MHTVRKQCTIGRTVSVSGFGFWSGRDVTLEFRPAEPDTGITFVRGDLPEPVSIKAGVANRVETPRRTTLRSGGASVEMVEHVMAALAGLQIDNCGCGPTRPKCPAATDRACRLSPRSTRPASSNNRSRVRS